MGRLAGADRRNTRKSGETVLKGGPLFLGLCHRCGFDLHSPVALVPLGAGRNMIVHPACRRYEEVV